MVIVNAFIDYDNTIFPTHFAVRNFYNSEKRVLELINGNSYHDEIIIQFKTLDSMLFNFFTSNMITTSFYIVTYGSKEWVKRSLFFLPKLQELIQEQKIRVLYCNVNSLKSDCILPILELNNKLNLKLHYIIIGDRKHDISMVNDAFSSREGESFGILNMTSFKFVENPHIDTIVWEWKHINDYYISYTRKSSPLIKRFHFKFL